MGIGTCPASSVMKLMEYSSSMHLVDDAQPIVDWCSAVIAICCTNSERVSREVVQLFCSVHFLKSNWVSHNRTAWLIYGEGVRAVKLVRLLRTHYPRKLVNFGI
jgi:hypothetical protein